RGVAAWSKATIWAILRNPIYEGTLVYAKTRYAELGRKGGKVQRPDVEHVVVKEALPAIVPRGLWEAAQPKPGARRFGVGRPWQRPYLLSGLIPCGHCAKRFQGHRPVRRSERSYYVCGGYVSSGVAVCDGLRVSTAYLDEAVLDGIQKRLGRFLNREVLRQRLLESLEVGRPQEGAVEALQARVADTRRKIDRLVATLAAGSEDLPSVRAALVDLKGERRGLEGQLAASVDRVATPAHTEEIIDSLLDALGSVRDVLEAGDAEERRQLVRLFLRGIEIRKPARQAIVTWYRVPNGGERSLKLVAPRGFGSQASLFVIAFEVLALTA